MRQAPFVKHKQKLPTRIHRELTEFCNGYDSLLLQLFMHITKRFSSPITHSDKLRFQSRAK